mgnify:CR=1 FL=1
MVTALLLTVISSLQLPATSDRAPVAFDHFPTPTHTFVWRNWQLVPRERMATVLDCSEEEVLRLGTAMGLSDPGTISEDLQRRSYITVIRRNWHLLPYPQLLALLDYTEEQLAFTLKEDDFLYIKLGSMKPNCPALVYAAPTEAVLAREAEIAATVKAHFPDGPDTMHEPLFQFVRDLSTPTGNQPEIKKSAFSPRYCSSYFGLFGDPLLEEDIDPYPDAYLEQLAASGVDGVWMHVVLHTLAPFPWDTSLSEHHEKRLTRLRTLAQRAQKHGIGIFLYMNEPRIMPLAFFDEHPELKGVVTGDHATLCTNTPAVQAYLSDSIAHICENVPELRGFFTITASENPTNCWSHGRGDTCPRCKDIGPASTIAGVSAAIKNGIEQAGGKQEVIAWDWGWRDEWAIDAINALPDGVALQSVSEWSIPINRGGVANTVGEYSISTIGPGPRATKHWAAARARGLKTIAKIQAGNTWELSAVPYIPALANVAQHGANLREANLDGMMLGWSLGGYPSPNLEIIAVMGGDKDITVEAAMLQVATRRYGAEHAPAVVTAWERCSTALSEFPYDGGVVYRAPIQMGPANLLYAENTGYASTMVGIPYDDLQGWRSKYPAEIFIQQFDKVATGFASAHGTLVQAVGDNPSPALQKELQVMQAAALHYLSVTNQARYVHARDAGQGDLEKYILEGLSLAKDLHAIQTRDSRMGYESSNHYFYVPLDLVEKVINCDYLLKR